ncbi:hypothetical protein D9Q98_007305 [Chlorella vulgaris]|uniref:Uncharacterized protein n=1 Tax=Chlorella vulgaris TaxID=3077 RepID=A0A9D4TLV6_CHLVU|nr:hypothetical protein D9Q98_007305 [Chlorella vulgaris]
MRNLCVAVFALLLASSAAAQAPAPETESKDIREGLERCLVMPESAARADYKPIEAACAASVPLEERCVPCGCALAKSLVTTLRSEGYVFDVQDLSQDEVSTAVSLCADTLLTAITDAGVDLNPILELAGCRESGTLPECLADL